MKNNLKFIAMTAFTSLTLVASNAFAVTTSMQPSLTAARAAIQAAEAYAGKLGPDVGISVAVVDQYGTLISLDRQDKAMAANAAYAQMKAFTAASFGISTTALRQNAQPGKPLYGIETAYIAGQKITLLDGGLPIVVNGKLIGGIGVGSTSSAKSTDNYGRVSDNAIAQAGLNAFMRQFQQELVAK